jgi:hypothetical protein
MEKLLNGIGQVGGGECKTDDSGRARKKHPRSMKRNSPEEF